VQYIVFRNVAISAAGQPATINVLNGVSGYPLINGLQIAPASAATDTTPPAVTITAPANNATVSGDSVTVSANASDDIGVVGVQFKLDGVNLGPEITNVPYSIVWRTTTAANSPHTLTAVARDAAGNQTTSAPVNVTVNNSIILDKFVDWVDDAVPDGAWTGSDGGDAWQWFDSNPTPFSGAVAHQSVLAPGIHYHYFADATTTLNVNPGDTMVAYVFIDPANPPQEIMLQWFDSGAGSHAAYWGENLIPWGEDGTSSQLPMGPLPAAGQWVALTVPAGALDL